MSCLCLPNLSVYSCVLFFGGWFGDFWWLFFLVFSLLCFYFVSLIFSWLPHMNCFHPVHTCVNLCNLSPTLHTHLCFSLVLSLYFLFPTFLQLTNKTSFSHYIAWVLSSTSGDLAPWCWGKTIFLSLSKKGKMPKMKPTTQCKSKHNSHTILLIMFFSYVLLSLFVPAAVD